MIHFACTHCHQSLHAPKEAVGQSGPCPHCNQTLTVPSPAPTSELPTQTKVPAQTKVPVQEPTAPASKPSGSARKVVEPLKATGLCAVLVALITLNHPLQASFGWGDRWAGGAGQWLLSLGAFGIIAVVAAVLGAAAGGMARAKGRNFRSAMAFTYAIALCLLTGAGGIAHVARVNLQTAASQARYEQAGVRAESVATPVASKAPNPAPLAPTEKKLGSPSDKPATAGVSLVSFDASPKPSGGSSPKAKAAVLSQQLAEAHGQIRHHVAQADAQLERLHDVANKAGLPSAAAKMEEARRTMGELVDDVGKLSEHYRDEIQATGCVRLLQTDRLVGDVNLAESDRMIAGMHEAFQHHVSGLANFFNAWIPRIKDVGWGKDNPSQSKEDEFRAVVDDMMANVKAGVLNEKEMLDCLTDVIAFLKERRNGWVARNHKLYFYRSSDSDKFNALMARNLDALTRQKELAAKIDNGSNEIVQKMKSILPGR